MVSGKLCLSKKNGKVPGHNPRLRSAHRQYRRAQIAPRATYRLYGTTLEQIAREDALDTVKVFNLVKARRPVINEKGLSSERFILLRVQRAAGSRGALAYMHVYMHILSDGI
ncbi:hypothetical protein BH24GEM3_BH24GEM3_00950 [soil metagenome]